MHRERALCCGGSPQRHRKGQPGRRGSAEYDAELRSARPRPPRSGGTTGPPTSCGCACCRRHLGGPRSPGNEGNAEQRLSRAGGALMAVDFNLAVARATGIAAPAEDASAIAVPDFPILADEAFLGLPAEIV